MQCLNGVDYVGYVFAGGRRPDFEGKQDEVCQKGTCNVMKVQSQIYLL